MSAASHPQKTELGLDELRRRTRGLSQRHRTMLLLVNGERTRREVLALAGQAGVGAEFFDELVVMGMVEAVARAKRLRVEAAAATTLSGVEPESTGSEWPSTRPGADLPKDPPFPISAPQLTAPAAEEGLETSEKNADELSAEQDPSDVAESVTCGATIDVPNEVIAVPPPLVQPLVQPLVPLRVPPLVPPHKAVAVVQAAGASGPPRPKRAAPPVLTMDDAVPPTTTAHKPSAAMPATTAAMTAATQAVTASAESMSARVRFTSAVHKPKPPSRRAPPVELRQEPHLTPVQPPARAARLKMPVPVEPLSDEHEARLLTEVRSLLIGTLLVDGPLTSSLIALRVRKARNRSDLTALVWEIERTLVRAKRPREAQTRLSKARDLLGLGNTVVDEETRPGPPTQPQR